MSFSVTGKLILPLNQPGYMGKADQTQTRGGQGVSGVGGSVWAATLVHGAVLPLAARRPSSLASLKGGWCPQVTAHGQSSECPAAISSATWDQLRSGLKLKAGTLDLFPN